MKAISIGFTLLFLTGQNLAQTQDVVSSTRKDILVDSLFMYWEQYASGDTMAACGLRSLIMRERPWPGAYDGTMIRFWERAYRDFGMFWKRLDQRDTCSVRLAFAMYYVWPDGGDRHWLDASLGDLIPVDARFFLEEFANAELSPAYLESILYPHDSRLLDDVPALRQEIEKWISALLDVKSPSLDLLKEQCLSHLRSKLMDIPPQREE